MGKTTTTANLGTGLALRGKSVVLVDTDIGLRNLDVVMGLENRIVYDLVDVMEGTCRLKQALIRDKRYEGLMLLPAAQTRNKNDVNTEQMKKLMDELRDSFDYILVDCPAGIEQGFQNAVAGANDAVVVTVPEVSAVRDADRIIGLLYAGGLNDVRLLINRYNASMVKKGDMMDTADILDILGIKLLGIVPEDPGVVRSSNLGEPIVTTQALAGQAYRNIVSRLLGEEVPLIEFKDDAGLFSRMKRMFSRG